MTTPVTLQTSLARGLLNGAPALREIQDPAVLNDQTGLEDLGLTLALYYEASVQEEAPTEVLQVLRDLREKSRRLVKRAPSKSRTEAARQFSEALSLVVERVGEQAHGKAVQRIQRAGVSLFADGPSVTARVREALRERTGSEADDLRARVADLERSMRTIQEGLRRCFSGDTYLKLEGGSVLSFEELARRHQAGEPLPKVASWDVSTGEVVYQTPSRLDLHSHVRTVVHHLQLLGPTNNRVELKVTGEHPLLVERGHGRQWIKVSDLQMGDRLIGQGGVTYRYLRGASYRMESSATVYNLSFSGDTALQPTFLVCMDPAGKDCVVAHNKD